MFGAAAVTREIRGGFECVGVWVNNGVSEGFETELIKDDYYVRDGNEISLLVTFLPGAWKVYLSGSIPVLAIGERGVTLRSLHRLGPLSDYGPDDNSDSAAATAQWVAVRYQSALLALGCKATAGLTAVVKKLAPGLGAMPGKTAIRRHVGMNMLARQQWLYGGRTEVFRHEAHVPVKQYDLRSAYAWAYRRGIAGRLRDVNTTIPLDNDTFFLDCDVEVPADDFVPRVPYRATDGTLVFPTGRWRTWLCGPEAVMALNANQVTAVHSVYHFDTDYALSDMADKLFSLRESTTCPVEKTLAKVLLVSGYGATAASDKFPLILVRPKVIPTDAELIGPGVYRVWQTPKASMAHVPGAAHITSRVRSRLYEGLHDHEATLYYCDTDCVFLDAVTKFEMNVGEKLGEWSNKGTFGIGSRFIAPKTYALGGGAVLRASGISSRNAEAYLNGESVTDGKRVGWEDTMTMGRQGIVPVELKLSRERVSKRIRDKSIEGRTLPLDVSRVA